MILVSRCSNSNGYTQTIAPTGNSENFVTHPAPSAVSVEVMLPRKGPGMSSRRGFLNRGSLAATAALLGARRLLAWQQPDDAKFSTGVNVVNVLVSVHDKDGQIVRNLTVNDFRLDEDGHPQTIRYFAQQSEAPLTLGLLVDTSGSERRVLDQERRASYQFFERVLREDKDRAFVIHFDREVELLQDLTSSRKDLEAALQNVDSARPQLNRRSQGSSYPDPQSGGGGYPQGGRRGSGGTELYDAVLLASDELMKKQEGRKSLILLSDGVDNGSKVSLSSAIESAQRADTLVYSIRFADEDAGSFQNSPFGGMSRRGGMGRGRMPSQARPDGKKILQQISHETGGEYFDVTKKMPLEKIFDRIEEDLRNQYNLGYTSDQTGGSYYRKIHVASTQKNQIVQARDGYYPASSK
jgi:VWFA-related protein